MGFGESKPLFSSSRDDFCAHTYRAKEDTEGAKPMHLQRNDMLSTEGRAPRARRSCYVNEPAYGFFIAGSSLKGMNGVYIRRNPPRQTDEEEEERQILLYYEHMDTSWTLVLAESSELAESSPYFHRSVGERSELAFVDERSHERFTHKGDTIVPGGDRRGSTSPDVDGRARAAGVGPVAARRLALARRRRRRRRLRRRRPGSRPRRRTARTSCRGR